MAAGNDSLAISPLCPSPSLEILAKKYPPSRCELAPSSIKVFCSNCEEVVDTKVSLQQRELRWWAAIPSLCWICCCECCRRCCACCRWVPLCWVSGWCQVFFNFSEFSLTRMHAHLTNSFSKFPMMLSICVPNAMAFWANIAPITRAWKRALIRSNL